MEKPRYLALAALAFAVSLGSAEASAAEPAADRRPAAHGSAGAPSRPVKPAVHNRAAARRRAANVASPVRAASHTAQPAQPATNATRAASYAPHRATHASSHAAHAAHAASHATHATHAASHVTHTTNAASHATHAASHATHAASHATQPPRIPASKPAARKPPPVTPPEPPDSVGHPNQGRLEGGARLDTSLAYIRVVPSHAAVDTRWGLPVFIKMIERAARGVARRYPGSVLDVGDISRKSGGDINGHHSHESGRDADLGFYAVDAKGKPTHAQTFIKFDASLSSPTVAGARFDLARNWQFIQSLLTDPGARVSHIFIAEPLRQSLLAYAKSRGVSRALWVRAAVAMMQPTESLPHDDHIHVRISCPRSMRGSCIELAKNAPTGRGRLAKLHRRGGQITLKTPSQSSPARRAPAASPSRPARATHGSSAASPTHPARATSRADQPVDQVRPASAPAQGRAGATVHASSPAHHGAQGVNEPEAEADAIEVRDALDESGTAKITQ